MEYCSHGAPRVGAVDQEVLGQPDDLPALPDITHLIKNWASENMTTAIQEAVAAVERSTSLLDSERKIKREQLRQPITL
jgi:hypothetical protein